MLENYLIVHKSILPDYFETVLKAKHLLEEGKAKNVMQAVKMAGISRSTYYKYKDFILEPIRISDGRKAVISMLLSHETGILSHVLSVISQAYDFFIQSPLVRLLLKGMQCGATALIVNVAVDLVRKQCKKRLAIPLVILVGTFVANFYFDVNLMLLVVMDGVLGLLLLRSPEYD